jgi:hypothetical protein
MSVWFTESFRGQALWDFLRSTSLTLKDWEQFARRTDIVFAGGKIEASGEFEEVQFPAGDVQTILDGKQRKEFMRIFATQRIPGKSGSVTRQLLKLNPVFKCGLNAVHKFFVALHMSKDRQPTTTTADNALWIKRFITQALITTAYSSRSQPVILEATTLRIDWIAISRAEIWLEYAASVRNMITMRWAGDALKSAHGQTRPLNISTTGKLVFPDSWIVYLDGWMTYVQTDSETNREYLALTTVDLDRLQQMCISMAMLELHQATFTLTLGNVPVKGTYVALRRSLEDILVSALKETTNETAQVLCRDMKKVFGTYLSMAAGELSDPGTLELLTEIKKEGYGKTFDSGRYLRTLKSAPFDLAQDLGRLFKILPAPDYDIGEAFAARQKELMTPNPTREIDGIHGSSFAEFGQYQRKLMILTLMAGSGHKGIGKCRAPVKPVWWNDYVNVGKIPGGLSWVDDIDLRGVVRYIVRQEDSATAYKDTVCCEEELTEAMEDRPTPAYKRNMLMRYLFDDTCPTQEKARKMLGRADHVHRVGFKMEAHKPIARLFYIGNMADRLIQSEMEENVHRIAQKAPGYMIGQTSEFSISKTMRMVAPSITPDERVFYLNFDLKRWSPGMAQLPQRMTHALFGEIFDRPEFLLAHKINENAIVLLNKRGYNAAFRNQVGNFEGYNGKEMTWLHCSLMGYSVYRYRKQSGHTITIELCAFIDDGLATFKDSEVNGPKRFLALVASVRETYESLGFVLEISKCYLSDVFAVFLNEIYFRGRHITYGLRSVMRIGTSLPEPTDTVFDEFNARAAGCQGAMKAGMDLISAYTVFLWTSAHILLNHKIDTRMDAKAAVLMLYAPKAFGGFQQPNLIAMSSNLASDGLAEGIATLQHMAKAYPSYSVSVCKLIRSRINFKSDESMLIAPRTVKAAGISVAETRIKQAVLKKLERVELSRRAYKLIGLGKGFDIAALARAVVTPNVLVVESLLTDIKEATPFAVVMALVTKFESARTIQQLIGIGLTKRIARIQRAELDAYLDSFTRRLRH